MVTLEDLEKSLKEWQDMSFEEFKIRQNALRQAANRPLFVNFSQSQFFQEKQGQIAAISYQIYLLEQDLLFKPDLSTTTGGHFQAKDEEEVKQILKEQKSLLADQGMEIPLKEILPLPEIPMDINPNPEPFDPPAKINDFDDDDLEEKPRQSNLGVLALIGLAVAL